MVSVTDRLSPVVRITAMATAMALATATGTAMAVRPSTIVHLLHPLLSRRARLVLRAMLPHLHHHLHPVSSGGPIVLSRWFTLDNVRVKTTHDSFAFPRFHLSVVLLGNGHQSLVVDTHLPVH